MTCIVHVHTTKNNDMFSVLASSCSLTHVSTEGHFSSSSWYGATVGPGWTQGIVRLSTSQSDELWSIPHKVELLFISIIIIIMINFLFYKLPIRITPPPQSSLAIILSPASTAGNEISVTGERGQTTHSVLSNISDGDLSVVSGDVG